MIGPCVCTTTYFCVSCRVKRGDYSDWQWRLPRSRILPPKASCSVEGCDKITASRQLCYLHYERWRVAERRHAPIPQAPYVKLADR